MIDICVHVWYNYCMQKWGKLRSNGGAVRELCTAQFRLGQDNIEKKKMVYL